MSYSGDCAGRLVHAYAEGIPLPKWLELWKGDKTFSAVWCLIGGCCIIGHRNTLSYWGTTAGAGSSPDSGSPSGCSTAGCPGCCNIPLGPERNGHYLVQPWVCFHLGQGQKQPLIEETWSCLCPPMGPALNRDWAKVLFKIIASLYINSGSNFPLPGSQFMLTRIIP